MRTASRPVIMDGVTSGAPNKSPSARIGRRRLFLLAAAASVFALVRTGNPADQKSFRFAILGDRTGEAVSGVYEEAWREAAAERPAENVVLHRIGVLKFVNQRRAIKLAQATGERRAASTGERGVELHQQIVEVLDFAAGLARR